MSGERRRKIGGRRPHTVLVGSRRKGEVFRETPCGLGVVRSVERRRDGLIHSVERVAYFDYGIFLREELGETYRDPGRVRGKIRRERRRAVHFKSEERIFARFVETAFHAACEDGSVFKQIFRAENEASRARRRRIPLPGGVDRFFESGHDGRRLGSRRIALRVEPSGGVPGEYPYLFQISDGLFRPIGDFRLVGEVEDTAARYRVESGGVQKSVRRRRHLLARYRLVRTKRAVRETVYDPEVRRPRDVGGIPRIRFRVFERRGSAAFRADQPAYDRDEHRAVESVLRRERLPAGPVHQAVFINVTDVRIKPVGLLHVPEGKGALRKDGSRERPGQKDQGDQERQQFSEFFHLFSFLSRKI